MTMFHAVAWVDHQSAQVMQFDAEHVQTKKLKAHSHPTGQHGSGVRTSHEFHAEVCNALGGINEVLLAGPKTGLADLRHYIEKHRNALTKQIDGWETHERLNENHLVALARQFFVRFDRVAGVPTPS